MERIGDDFSFTVLPVTVEKKSGVEACSFARDAAGWLYD